MITYFPKPLNKQVAAISDSLTRTQKGLGIGASGDTHAAIDSGQFVYVKDHSSLAEGLYKSKAAIAQNGALSTSNLTADDSGGLNDLQSQATNLQSQITSLNSKFPNGYGQYQTISSGFVCPSDGVISVVYALNDIGYCYLQISGIELFTSKENTNGGLTFNYLAFKGNVVTFSTPPGSVRFIPYTYG